jgi:hypothetical protein
MFAQLQEQGRRSWRIFLVFCATEKKHLGFTEAWGHIARVYVRLFKAALGIDTSIFDIYKFVTSQTGIAFSVLFCSIWLWCNGFSF